MAKDKDPFDDLFEPFELEDGPPAPGTTPPPAAPTEEPQPTPSAPVEQVACPSCGAYNPSYNRHCEQCGARLTKEPLPVAPAPMVRATPGGRALSVLAAAVLVVALIALLVNVFRGGGTVVTTTQPTEPTTSTVISFIEITPTAVSATSQISDGFSDAKVIDGDFETEWQVLQSQDPLTLEFRFAQPVQIQYIEIYNITDEDRFRQNYRIDAYSVTVDDLVVDIRNNLKDEAGGPHRIDIASFETTLLTLDILRTYPSQAIGDLPAFEELAVAEVKFWGTSG